MGDKVINVAPTLPWWGKPAPYKIVIAKALACSNPTFFVVASAFCAATSSFITGVASLSTTLPLHFVQSCGQLRLAMTTAFVGLACLFRYLSGSPKSPPSNASLPPPEHGRILPPLPLSGRGQPTRTPYRSSKLSLS